MDKNNNKESMFSELLGCLKSTFFLSGVVLALFVWILNPFIDAVFLNQGTIYQQLFHLDIYEAYLRSVISAIIIIFSLIGSFLLNRSRQAEETLQSSDKRFRALYDNNPKMFFTIDEYGKVLSVNQFGIDQLGYSKDQLVGKPVINVFYEKDRPLAQEHLKQCFAEPNKVHNWNLRKIRQDGTIFYVHETVRLVDDIDGKLMALIVCEDITEHKRAEETLRANEKRLRAIYDQSNDAIFLLDIENDQILDFNRTAVKLLGYSLKELLGAPISMVHPHEMDKLKNFAQSVLEGGGDVTEELTCLTKSRVRIPVEISASYIEIKGKSYLLALVRDITERKQVEEERIKLEQQLIQSEKMETIGQLTGGIAHDFNNLLSIINGNLRFLQEDIGEVSTEIEELFEDALSAVDDGTELTQSLLAFSRSRNLNPEINNVDDTIEKFVRFLSRTLGQNIELDIELANEDLFISVDPSQLENALLNLFINARDAMPEGGTITISATRYHHGDGEGEGEGLIFPEGDYIKIAVADNGSGISSKDLEHVYEPFFTTKEAGQGSGLGLSIVYGFTQQSNGSCHISSVSGKGTTVSLYFPEVMDNKNIDKKPEDDEELSMRGSEVILVVEDEPRVRRVALRDLKKLGYKTLEAGNANMAKTIIKSGEPIDLIFSDILMPGKINGYKLATWTEKNFPEIKIILTSGYNKGKADVRRDEAHPFPFIRKPYSIDKLAKQIRATLTE